MLDEFIEQTTTTSASSEERKRKELVENILSDYDSTKTRLVIIDYNKIEDKLDIYVDKARSELSFISNS